MFEVYTGSRPGRPTLLLLLAAGGLIGALGLAWAQVRESRALGDEVRIDGTPLIVRPPAGWVAGRDHRGVFVKTIVIGHRGRQREAIERSIKFDYRRWRFFQPLPDLLRFANLLDAKQAYEPVPAQIGGFDGVQVRRARSFLYRGRKEHGESIYRLVSTARGDQISVEYTPLGEVTAGDMELFDAVCDAVKLDDPGLNMDPDEVVAQAGVRFSIDENWTILGPDFPEIHGLHVQNSQNGVPNWGLGVFRTWLAPGRGPLDLLRNLAELTDSGKPGSTTWAEPQQLTRSDGAAVASLQRSDSAARGGQVVSAWAVAESAAEAVLIFALADSGAAQDADQAAARLAEEVEFLDNYPAEGIDAARAGGREIADLISRDGAAPWWGHDENMTYRYGEISGMPLLLISYREPIDGDPARGYAGFDRYLHRDPVDERNHPWTIGGHAEAYTSRLEADFDRRGQARTVLCEERRESGEASIRRQLAFGPKATVLTVPVGATFVCPPVETIAQAIVVQREEGTVLIEVSAVQGSSTYTQLVTPLDPDEQGRSRVLLVRDYWPRGTIVTFDSGVEVAHQELPAGHIERITQSQARDVQRALGRR